jgi:hypothetical protein
LFITLNSLSYFSGIRYEQENEEDLKEKMDFLRTDPEHYPSGGENAWIG